VCRYYFFAGDAGGAFFLVELVVNRSTLAASATVKAQGAQPAAVALFSQLLQQHL
jgi:hypothetical protein